MRAGLSAAGNGLRLLPMAADDFGAAREHSWSELEAGVFNVRQGPDYKRTGVKGPSEPAFYSCSGVEVFKSVRPPEWLGPALDLPPLPPAAAVSVPASGAALPRRIVLNMCFPRYAASWGGAPEGGGENSTFCVVFRLTPAAAAESRRPLNEQSNALRLLRRWAYATGGGDTSRQPGEQKPRTKYIVKLANDAELGVPYMLRFINGKGVMVIQ